MIRLRAAWPVVVVCLIVATAGPVAAATPAETEAQATARAHFRRAESDYAAGRYAEALAEYQAGYDAAPLPGFLVNIAQCQRRLGDLARARATYSRFIMVAPDSPLVPEVRNLVAELDRLLAQSQVADGQPSAPAGPDDVVAPGTQGTATSPGPISTGEGGTAKAAAPVPVAPEPSTNTTAGADLVGAGSPPETSSGGGRKWWLWGGIAAAVVGAVVVAVVLSTRDPDTIHDGSLGTVRR